MTDWAKWYVDQFDGKTEDEVAESLAKILNMDKEAAREKLRRALLPTGKTLEDL